MKKKIVINHIYVYSTEEKHTTKLLKLLDLSNLKSFVISILLLKQNFFQKTKDLVSLCDLIV
jgi:hypothetical protein